MAPSAIDVERQETEDKIKTHPSSNGKTNGMQSHTNGHLSNGHAKSSTPSPTDPELLDLLCIGCGPASLAIAIALHDAYENSSLPPPKARFLEKQPQFAWHAGMQLPGAHMQISFLKDLATPRNPRSKFTFINYLFAKGRLNQFINLSTFLPSRLEYEDYLRWCASHFESEGKVAYSMNVESVRAGTKDASGRVTSWEVTARNSVTGESSAKSARHVVIAVGGRPVVPQHLQGLKHISHSSAYAQQISRIVSQSASTDRPLKFAVIGSGQSAAEIFSDLWSRFPESSVKLIIKGASLRPSDDSPFVNEIFDPDRVDGIFAQEERERAEALKLDRGTNYGVVRLSLLEALYERLYMQRLTSSSSEPKAQILPQKVVLSATQTTEDKVLLKLGSTKAGAKKEDQEELEADYVFTATGYIRNAHESMLSEVRNLLPEKGKEEKFPVGRDYRVLFGEERVDDSKAGVWLQGCNEGTHGVSLSDGEKW